MEALGVIPARGGSTRIPRKNMRELGGKPLLQWTVEAALSSRLSRVVVSTEDPEIGALAVKCGAELVPQPLESALSGTRSAPVVMSALDFLRDAHGYRPDAVCLLHPTSPFRSAADIDQALEMHERWNGSVISFTNDDTNGAIYVMGAEKFRSVGTFFTGPIWPLTLSDRKGLDIDTWDDLERARGLA